ncbi:hypothetical protein GX48_04626 [Paracoccidioides brasiliensis]|nr:hypothetical protein GX48_04626 [Paracoccidioides brasiliensis]
MSRRSSRLVLQSSAAEQQKKRASDDSSPFSFETSRETKRQKSSKAKVSARGSKPAKSAEGKKSRYFKKQVPESLDPESSELSEAASATTSAFEESKADSADVPSITDESESNTKPQKKRGDGGWAGGRKRKTTAAQDSKETGAGSSAAQRRKGNELWREGVKAGLGPGKEVFIKLPKARDAGDTPYEDGTIHPNTLLFLKDLKENNEREWFKMHDADFRTSKRDWDTFVESLTEKIMEKDSTIPELPAKDLMWIMANAFRSHTSRLHGLELGERAHMPHITCIWSQGNALLNLCVPSNNIPSQMITLSRSLHQIQRYLCPLHGCGLVIIGWIGPNIMFALKIGVRGAVRRQTAHEGAAGTYHYPLTIFYPGSGLWHLEVDKLALLRQDIDQNSRRIKSILNAPDVRKEIFNGVPKNEKEAVLAFVGQNQENALKTKPKGYDADNKNIDLIRLRGFTMSKRLQDKDLLGPKALDKVAHIVGIMAPFVTYLNSVVMPDPPSHSDNEGDDDDEGGNGDEVEEGADQGDTDSSVVSEPE